MSKSSLQPNLTSLGELTEGKQFVPREARVITILLVARLVSDRSDDLCRVRNLSTEGMLLESRAPLSVGQRVRVELRSLMSVEGEIVWVKGPHAGMRFDTATDVGELLQSTVTGAGAYVPRAPRMSAGCAVHVRRDGRLSRATLLDLSQHGCKLRSAEALTPDDRITVSIPGLGPNRAVVRWTRDHEAGAVFLELISLTALELWLGDRPIRYAAGRAQTDGPERD